MKNLYFIRHGESQAQLENSWALADCPLSKKGRAQATSAGREAFHQGLIFDPIISSPFQRAVETAQLLASELGYPISKIVINDLFQERSFGILNGTANARDFFDNHVYKDLDDVEDAETVRQLQQRAKRGLAYLESINADTILLVGHEDFGRALRRVIESKPCTQEYTEPFPQIPNAQIIRLT